MKKTLLTIHGQEGGSKPQRDAEKQQRDEMSVCSTGKDYPRKQVTQ